MNKKLKKIFKSITVNDMEEEMYGCTELENLYKAEKKKIKKHKIKKEK